jgi:hypothetical protein
MAAATLHVLNPPTYASVPFIRVFVLASLYAAWTSQANMNNALAKVWESVRTTAWFRYTHKHVETDICHYLIDE